MLIISLRGYCVTYLGESGLYFQLWLTSAYKFLSAAHFICATGAVIVPYALHPRLTSHPLSIGAAGGVPVTVLGKSPSLRSGEEDVGGKVNPPAQGE